MEDLTNEDGLKMLKEVALLDNFTHNDSLYLVAHSDPRNRRINKSVGTLATSLKRDNMTTKKKANAGRLKLTQVEVRHIINLLAERIEDGSYYGNKTHYYNRSERIMKKLQALEIKGPAKI